MLSVSAPPDAWLRQLLASHPEVQMTEGGSDSLRFNRGDWPREARVGWLEDAPCGLVELMDNNPLVCADQAAVPSPATTLALLALQPLMQARLVVGPIVVQSSIDAEADELLAHLESLGLADELTWAVDPEVDLGPVAAISAMVPCRNLDDWRELDELYEEAYGRSFYVRPCDEWNWEKAAGAPHALYDLRVTVGETESLVTVRVMADRRGKLGACQLVHLFNVMNGFEECIGIPERF